MPVPTEIAIQLGLATAAMAQSPHYCQYPIACITLWIEPAIRHEQIHFFRGDRDHVIGYLTWARLTEETAYRLVHDPQVILHISEWNEGDQLWIIDFLVLDGGLRSCLVEAAALFRNDDCVRSLRRREDGQVRKVSTWRRVTSSGIFRARK